VTGKNETLLIVNADDYGYCESVSRGILDGAREGVITATGVLANCQGFGKQVADLSSLPRLDAGVHLTLTSGCPLTVRMRSAMGKWNGQFPRNKYSAAGAVLSGMVTMSVIEEEWEAQIRRCLDAGLVVRFLNSHEHLHGLPGLFRLSLRLAQRHHIPFVRVPSAEWREMGWGNPWLRNFVLAGLSRWNARVTPVEAPVLLGVSVSGQLNLSYLKRLIPSLKRGEVYELMCHPGYLEKGEMNDPRLLAFHNWLGELEALRSREFRELCAECGIRFARFRDISVLKTF
jgi:chitin disaccharide deacetylase